MTKVLPSMKTAHKISKINVFTKYDSTFNTILEPSTTDEKEKFIINDFLEFPTDFKGCYAFDLRLCADIKCSADLGLPAVEVTAIGKEEVPPNAITGIPKLELSISRLKPFSSYVYIGVYTDEKNQGKLGVIKG